MPGTGGRVSRAALVASLVAAATMAAPDKPTSNGASDVILALSRYGKVASSEGGALSDLRVMVSAQMAYRATTGAYGSLACLQHPAGCGAPAGTTPFLDAGAASAQRWGYRRRLVVGSTFAYLAVPEKPGETGLHGFCTDESGRVCYTRDGSEPALAAGRCAPSCPEWKIDILEAARPRIAEADLRAALAAIDEPPLSSQPEAARELWRALIHAALAEARPGGLAKGGRAYAGAAGAVAFTPDGRTLVTGSVDRSPLPLKAWSVADGGLTGAFGAECESVWSLRVTPDGASVLASCGDRTVRRWSLAERRESAVLAKFESSMIDLGLSADGRLLAAGASGLGEPGTAKLSTLPAGRALGTVALPAGAGRVALSPDGRTLASGGFQAPLQLWSVPDGRPIATLGRPDDASAMAISHDSRLLAFASGRSIHLWSIGEKRQVGSIAGHGGVVNQLAFCPDGRLLSASSDHSVKLWTVPDGRLVGTLRGHADEVFGVAVSPDGKLAASADRAGVVVLWDLEKMTQLRVLADPGL